MTHVIITTETVLIEQGAVCIACGRTFEAHPIDFLYFIQGLEGSAAPEGALSTGGGYWVTCGEVAAQGIVSGYCGPCASAIAGVDHEEYMNGNWEQRTIEDETWVWPS